MVLAAGFGTRMLPVTRFLPKALLPVAGRPLLEWNLRHLASHGVVEAVVNAHHLAEEMRRWEATRATRGEEGFPRVRLVVEPTILGTGGGIANAAAWLDSDPVIVVNADQLFRPDLAAARRTHQSGRFLATLLCVRDPRHAQVRAMGPRATAIEPRPVFGDPGLLTFTGVYFLAREGVERVAVAAGCSTEPGRRVPSAPVRFLDIVPLFREWMAEGRLGVHLVEDAPFLEAGSPEAYLELLREAERILSTPRPAIVHGFGFVSAGAKAAADAWIEESAVLDGAVVEPGARVIRSILGSRAVARGEVVRCIAAGDESRGIRLLLAAEEEELEKFIARSWPETQSQHRSSRISLRLLKGDGSARRVLRVVRGAESRVVVLPAVPDPGAASIYPVREGPGVPDEAATFAYVAAHLERLGVPVPRVFTFDADSGKLLLEDLGDTHLYNLVLARRQAGAADGGAPDGAAPAGGTDRNAPRRRDSGHPAADRADDVALLRAAYEEAIDILLRLQAPPPEPFDPARTQNPDYDSAFILRYEAGYFLREMVRGRCGLEPADLDAVQGEFTRAAEEATSAIPPVLMHRDFQSRNLMRTPRGLVVIDFQGARPGPPEYDLAALLLDPYADLPEALRIELAESYFERAARTPTGRAAARRRFRACGINRMLQVLGAFGYLGGRLGKPDFLEHAPAALARLAELSREEFPGLYKLAERVRDRLAGPG